MFEELKEVFELATNCTAFVNELLKIKNSKNKLNQNDKGIDCAQLAFSGDCAQLAFSGDCAQLAFSGDYAQLASSGYGAQLASSGYGAQLASSGYGAQLASSGYGAQLASSGGFAQLASSGYSAQLASSGGCAKLASSGDYAKLASSGYGAQLASSGGCAKLASSGDCAQLAFSGDCAKLASSGDYAKLASSGEKAVIAAIGFNNIAKAKKGSWITLAEYDKDNNNNWVVSFVKTEFVDGQRIKEDCFYTLYNKEFYEVEEIDNIKTIILKRKRNIIKGVFLNDKTPCYVFEKDRVFAHGKTVKQAYLDWLFKTSDRDVNRYQDIKLDEVHDLNFWVIAYRTITGACSFGTNNYLENNKDKYKDKMTLQEVLTATEGQYGHNTFKEFFERE